MLEIFNQEQQGFMEYQTHNRRLYKMTIYTHKMVNGEQVALTQEEIQELEARDLAYQAEQVALAALKPINDAKAELAELDKKVPRGTEDLYNALSPKPTLPQYTIDILTRKEELRAIIRG
jgi:hypothetical protein